MIFFTFFFKNKLLHLLACQRELLNLQEWIDCWESYFVGKEKATFILGRIFS